MEQFISLKNAQELCPYSKDYLSLRARQGKLQAIKVGRNWSTTREWLGEYLAKSDEYKKAIEAKRSAGQLQKQETANTSAAPWVEPPFNLPVYAPDADALEYATAAEIAERAAFWQKFQFAAAAASLTLLFLVSVAQERDAVARVADQVRPAVISASADALSATEQVGTAAGEKVLAAGIGEIAQEYFVWLTEPLRGIAGWFGSPKEGEATIAEYTVEEKPARHAIPKSEKKGLVVIPSTNEDEKVKERVKQSFSDEVLVTPRDDESGIITPVFRERAGEDYLYILVPLFEQE